MYPRKLFEWKVNWKNRIDFLVDLEWKVEIMADEKNTLVTRVNCTRNFQVHEIGTSEVCKCTLEKLYGSI